MKNEKSIFEQVETIRAITEKMGEESSKKQIFAMAHQIGTMTGIFMGLPDTPENRAFLAGRIAALEKELSEKKTCAPA